MQYLATLFLCLLSLTLSSQNLPSLLSGKNINATFSILAYDAEAQEWGIAVATNNLYVGNSTVYIEPGLGAFSVIAETHPPYAHNGFQQLKQGATIEQAILSTKNQDAQAHFRQVAGIDKSGNVFAFTGEALTYWQGTSSHLLGESYVVMGNQLDENVLQHMSRTYERTRGTLAERLFASLIAGQLAGGQVSGKQSAALVVKGTDNQWYNQIDLRVDHSQQPFVDLQKLLDYHYGRIQLNQAYYAFDAGNRPRAAKKLARAEKLLEGWNGMYSKIAYTHSLMGNDTMAVVWIQKALLENPSWRVNLPAFYYLRYFEEVNALLDLNTFTIKDWETAISMYICLNRQAEAVNLCRAVSSRGMESSYLEYLRGKSLFALGKEKAAQKSLAKALKLDATNVEAKLLWEEIIGE